MIYGAGCQNGQVAEYRTSFYVVNIKYIYIYSYQN